MDHEYTFELKITLEDGQGPPEPYVKKITAATQLAASEEFCAGLLNAAHQVERQRGEPQEFEDVEPAVTFVSPPGPGEK